MALTSREEETESLANTPVPEEIEEPVRRIHRCLASLTAPQDEIYGTGDLLQQLLRGELSVSEFWSQVEKSYRRVFLVSSGELEELIPELLRLPEKIRSEIANNL